MAEQAKDSRKKAKDIAIDVRNEAAVQSENLYVLVRRVLLASLGAVAISVEEAQSLLDKLVERGEIAEKDARELLRKSREQLGKGQEKAEKAGQERGARAEEVLEQRINTLLERFNVPSKGDIDELSHRVSELNERIDAMSKQREM